MRILRLFALATAGMFAISILHRSRKPAMTDLLTSRLFTGASTARMDAATAKALPIPHDRIPWLVGAFDESVIDVIYDAAGNSFLFEVSHPRLDGLMQRVLWQDPDNGQLYLMWNEAFFLRPGEQCQGLGTRSLAIELREVAHLGVQSVGCRAAGQPGSEMNGYYTWPLLGFDAELEDEDVESLPDHLGHCTTLNELFLEEGGAEHWRHHGRGMTVFFDLTPGSASWFILEAYLDARGIKL